LVVAVVVVGGNIDVEFGLRKTGCENLGKIIEAC
jgi:hypothetical protein